MPLTALFEPQNYLLSADLDELGLKVIAVDLLALLSQPGLDTLLAAGGLAAWLNWPHAVVALLGQDQDYSTKRLTVDRFAINYRLPQGQLLTVTPAQWVTWQRQLGLNYITAFEPALELLSKNKQKVVKDAAPSWQLEQQRLAQYSLLARADIHVVHQPLTLAVKGIALAADKQLSLLQADYHSDLQPLVSDCLCSTCQYYSRAYLHQLLVHHQAYGVRLLAVHNVFCYLHVPRAPSTR